MTDTKVFLIAFTTSAVTAVIARIFYYLMEYDIFIYTCLAAVLTMIGSVIIWCIYGAITRPAFARKFQAEVDEHKENLAKGGFVPPVRAAVHNSVLIDRMYEGQTGEPAPKIRWYGSP